MGFPLAKGSSFKEGISDLPSLIKNKPFIFPEARKAAIIIVWEGKVTSLFSLHP